MKILVTGAGTLVGQTIARQLSKKNSVIASYNKSFPLELKNNKKIKLVKIDISKNITCKFDFDMLVHCASIVPAFHLAKKKYKKINVEGFKKLINICKSKNIKKIVLLSSMSVYGKIKSKSITEKTKFIDPDPYGVSKIKMEKILKDYCKIYSADGLVLRLPGIIGYKSKHNFLSHAFNFIRKNKFININNPYLKFNNVAHVENIANIISTSIIKNKNFTVFNIGTTYPLLFIKIFEKIFKILKIKKKILFNKNLNKGFNIKLNNKLIKNYKLYSTKFAIEKFVNENLN